MHAQVRSYKFAWGAAALVAAALASCAAPRAPREVVTPPDTDAAARLVELGRPADAAAIYARAADRAPASEGARLRVRAAELMREAGDAPAADELLSRVDLALLDDYGTWLARLLAAELSLHDGRPAEALQQLPPTDELPRALAARALQVEGAASLLLGEAATAVTAFVARDPLLSDPAAIAANHEQVWRALRRVDAEQAETGDRALDGWLQLAELRRRAWQDPWNFDAALAAWRRAYPRHPAGAEFVPRLIDEQRRLAVGVHEFAVLVPLSGRFASAGAAVRDGFLAALYRTPADAGRPIVRFYDTGDVPEDAARLYQEAVASGADFVVGPLQKEGVAALARLESLPVPVLALNTLDDGPRPDGLFTFGLVPEDEATQIADRAAIEGRLNAVALVPDSELGARMLAAFAERLRMHGGTLLASEWYDPRQRDHSAPITRALAIDESRQRLSTLRVVLQADLTSEPRRRRDAEFVFLVATPQQARSLRPQLRFHHASDLPVYASSHVYSGLPDRSADADLNGVAFTDMPWVIEPGTATADTQRRLLAHFGPEMERNTRLFALGYDAYRLAPVLRHDPALLQEPIPAATGALSLTDEGRIERALSWAEFRGGLARPLAAPVLEPAETP